MRRPLYGCGAIDKKERWLPAQVSRREPLVFEGPAGRLDARAHGPETGRPVLLLHPHPRGEGSMGSRLVYDLARGLAAEGHRTYRFDFRGVGSSEGAYADGLGETEDALSVFDALLDRHGTAPVVIGHSFGGAVGIRLATRRTPPLLIVIGVPPTTTTSRLTPIEDAPSVAAAVHLIVGDRDRFVTPDEAMRLKDAFGGRAGLTVLEDAGHFLEPTENPRVLAETKRLLGSL